MHAFIIFRSLLFYVNSRWVFCAMITISGIWNTHYLDVKGLINTLVVQYVWIQNQGENDEHIWFICTKKGNKAANYYVQKKWSTMKNVRVNFDHDLFMSTINHERNHHQSGFHQINNSVSLSIYITVNNYENKCESAFIMVR